MKNKVLISVLNYNNFESTKKCVLSILNCSLNNIEIYIVDNKSPDNSYQKLKDYFKDLKVVKSKTNNGYAAGHKISVNYAVENKFDFIWVLNNDLTVRNETLPNLLSVYDSLGLGIYGSITLKSENPDIVNFGGGNTANIKEAFDYNAYEDYLLEDYYKVTRLRKVQSVEGSSMLIPLEIIKEHGFMREDFFMYGEETDYCYKLKKLDIPSFIVPESVVVHKGGESLKKSKHLELYYRRRNILCFEKEHYGISIFKNLQNRVGVFCFIKFYLKHKFIIKQKDELYYLNMAILHALIGKKGKFN
ncbi:glycosyltransferase family 2 protein [Flavobacteriales bacterium]|nr:glycosyltransferase family 2 protein [Flavobacteriales bacterium]